MNNTKIKYFEELTKFTYSTVLDGYNGSFMGCTNLERVDLTGKTHLSPRETSDKSSYGLFRGCSNLQTIGDISNINIIPYCAFHYCSKLKEKIITTATSLRGRCFEGCSQIPSIIILTSTVPSLTVTYGTTCSIYVRPELYKSFMVATNWSSYRSRIKNFFTGPVLIIKDGVYTYSLRTEAFEEYQGLTFSIDENDYLSLNFDGETATITASGIVSGVDEPVGVHYSFIYRGKEVSGTFNISVTYKEIIDFEDAEVKRICVANWGGEYCASTNKYGVPGELTMEQAAAVEQLAEVFRGNTVITAFEELRFFTKIKAGGHSFRDCSKLRRVSINSTQWQFSYMVASGTTIRWNVIKMKNDGLSSSNWGTRGMGGNTVVLLREHKVYPLMENQQGTPKYYVPDDLVESYKTATNWTAYASRIYPLSEYTGEYPES